jgi:uncharacterized protein
MSEQPLPWSVSEGGILLRVRVTPKSSKDVVSGPCETPDGPALQLKVRAVPAEGAANKAVEQLIARWLGVPKSGVSLKAGAKSRVKLLHVIGTPATLVEMLRAKLAVSGASK